MANYPASVYSPRTKTNRPGITYDATKSDVAYVEDITKLDDEVVAIENDLIDNPPVRKIATLIDVDLTTGGTTVLYTVPTGKKFIPTAIIVRDKNISAPGYDGNISWKRDSDSEPLFWSDTMTVGTAGEIWGNQQDMFGAFTPIAFAAGDKVNFIVDTADSGTTFDITIDLIGYLLDV